MGTEIKAVTFDAGGTLIRPWPSVGHVYAESAARHGLKNISPDAVNRSFAKAWRELVNFNHGRDEWAALVDKTFTGLVERPPSETFFPDLYDRFGGTEVWRIFDDAIPAIEALASQGINLGIISNWDERLGPLLEKLDLKKYFSVVVISCETGFPKPSPVIFEHAARKLGSPPESILHVGDSVRDDVEGAGSAGFQSVLIDRDSKGARAGVIDSLLELAKLAAGSRME